MAIRGGHATAPAYVDLRRMPGGGVAEVHHAKHAVFGVEVVQKTYECPGREDALAFQEPRLLLDLQHDHIIKIFEAQPDPDRAGHVTLVTPYHPGGDLRALLATGHRISLGQALEWTAQVASALQYLHERKRVLHRDVKPGNILIGSAGEAILCDFGSAAATSVTGHAAPVRATYPYQPPEMMGQGWMNDRSDIYSLGLVAIELIDGRFLYDGLGPAEIQSRVDTGKRGYTDAALASARRPPHVHAAVRTLLGRCVSLAPADRPSAAELCAALGRLKVVDWTHVTGGGLDGEWLGVWPARARSDRALTLRVVSRVAERGPNKGKRVLEATYRLATATSFRSIGSAISPTVLDDAHDAAAVSAFFKTVSAVAARRWPT